MEQIKKMVSLLSRVRGGIPQLIFYCPIHPGSFLQVRKAVIDLKKKSPEVEEIDVIVHSPGGMPDDAYRIIRTLRSNFKVVNIVVPFWAKSAATLMALGGSIIVMDEAGELGPLDVQLAKTREDGPEFDRESALIDEYSLKRLEQRYREVYESMYIRLYEHKKINLSKTEMSRQLLDNLAKFYEPLMKQIDPYKLGDKRRKLDIGYQYGSRILSQYHSRIDQYTNRDVVDYLVNGCPDHGYIIDYELISSKLDIVKQSKIWGEEYQSILTELSLYLVLSDAEDEVCFIHDTKKATVQDNNISKKKPDTKLVKSARNPKFAQNGKESKTQSRTEVNGQGEIQAI
ncbi:SDH family Clp fold serine proteinase [Chitinophaga cymbidii]|uniref:Serine protease n=1 Tax=Chitinophaga cymbidii TaxID=1096750 RepID=A0A512RIM7_9BACT|nr:hypothetical protein [Chitinophaga cymbidii]GEP95534.1 hypothetical protein CCY01nite_17940 [Chitinophaga cymbidii]